jgi:hypothetical protein
VDSLAPNYRMTMLYRVAVSETAVDAAESSLLSCARCGDFALLYPRWGKSWCRACLDRRDALELSAPTWSSLVHASLQLTARMTLSDWLFIAAFGVAPQLWQKLGPSQPGYSMLILWAYHLCVTLIATSALQRLAFLRVVDSDHASLREALQHVQRKYPQLLITNFAETFLPLVYAVPLIVPGVVRIFGYVLAMPIVLNENATIKAALSQSMTRTKNHRGTLSTAYLAFWLPLVVVQIVFQSLTRTLDKTWLTGLGIELGSAFLSTCVQLPMAFLPIALQLKLTAASSLPAFVPSNASAAPANDVADAPAQTG